MFINKDKWLSKKIKYETDIVNNDIINDIMELIIEWILDKDDLEITSTPEDIKQSLIMKLLPKK